MSLSNDDFRDDMRQTFVALRTAGYMDSQRGGGYVHSACGQRVSSDRLTGHDCSCPANGNGRQEPRLPDWFS